jgi:hypothetical protein
MKKFGTPETVSPWRNPALLTIAKTVRQLTKLNFAGTVDPRTLALINEREFAGTDLAHIERAQALVTDFAKLTADRLAASASLTTEALDETARPTKRQLNRLQKNRRERDHLRTMIRVETDDFVRELVDTMMPSISAKGRPREKSAPTTMPRKRGRPTKVPEIREKIQADINSRANIDDRRRRLAELRAMQRKQLEKMFGCQRDVILTAIDGLLAEYDAEPISPSSPAA